MLRTLLLRASESALLGRLVPRLPPARRAVRRFMPGESAGEAVAAAGALANDGLGSVLTQLGENVVTPEEAHAVADGYAELFGTVAAGAFPAEISIKLTHLGLDVDPALTRDQCHRLAAAADLSRSFLWVDMESSRYTDATLEIYRELRTSSRRVGICLQANLLRTPADVEALLPLGPAIRLVKGAYREDREVAHTGREAIDAAYRRLALRLLDEPRARLVLGTHDLELLGRIETEAHPAVAAEVHMLYGVRTAEARELASRGRAVRILISYGPAWYPWFMRRLAERPANLRFVLPTWR